jgi:hypothetical protein
MASADRARAELGNLLYASNVVVVALRAWQRVVAPDCNAPRIADTVNVTNDTVGAIVKALAALDVTHPLSEKHGENSK